MLKKNLVKQKDKLIKELIGEFQKQNKAVKGFNEKIHKRVDGFMKETAKNYGTKYGKRGNVTLMNEEQTLKIVRQRQNSITFDEKLQIAKELIDECITEWGKTADSKIIAILKAAFKVDKQGKIAQDKILGLKRLGIEDKKWQKAMQAIDDSLTVQSSKMFLRAYKKDKNGAWQNITINIGEK